MEAVLPGAMLVALLFVGLGLIQLFAPTLAWELAQMNNSLFGRNSERTAAWERGRIFFGILSILAGIGIGLLVWGATQAQNMRAAEAEMRAAAQQLSADFADMLWVLEANASAEPQRISAADLGIPQAATSQVYYGTCGAGFYVLVLNHWGGLGDVAYTTRGGDCLPPSLYTTTGNEQVLGSTPSGRWLKLWIMPVQFPVRG